MEKVRYEIDPHNRLVLVLSILLFFVIPAENIFSLNSDDVVVLVDGDYFLRLRQELANARESIYVEMYLAKLEEGADGYVSKLAEELIKAQRRGVLVKIVLEDAPWHDMNKNIYDLLAKEKIDVSYDAQDKVLHSKVVVIDGHKSIIGSHNWSHYGLSLNNEAGVLIESEEVAQAILNQTYEEDEPDVAILDENNYFSELISAIKGAGKSIYAAMYDCQLNPARSYEAASLITRELAAAKTRGVDVHIVLDQNFSRQKDRFGRMQSVVEKRNLSAMRRLKDKGVDVRFDTANRVLHSKAVVIDRQMVIVGSQNWTEQSKANDEVSVLVKSKPAAETLLEAIEGIETEPAKLSSGVYDEGYAIKVPWGFFSGIGSEMYTNQAFKALDLYLLLLWEWDGNPEAKVELDYERLTRLLGGKEGLVKRVLRDLDSKYALIRYDKDKDCAYLSGLGDRNKPFVEAKTESVELPIAFWEYGWNRRLSMKAKYLYFIGLIERQKSTIKPWWFDSQERLSERYGISVKSIVDGLLELQRYNLIEIYRFSPEPGEPYWHRWSNQYYINELVPPAVTRQLWVELEKRYSKIDVKRAKGLARQLNEPDDPEIVERFVQLIKEYGYKAVRRANNITAKLRVENPKRHIGYTISILKGEGPELVGAGWRWQGEGFFNVTGGRLYLLNEKGVTYGEQSKS
ncbi:MAG: phospholipase D-like domain-containing protein [Nitrospirota bacterium]